LLLPDQLAFHDKAATNARAHRDAVNAKVMKDPRIGAMCDPKDMPFDCARMLYGGFKTIVEA